MGTSDLFAKPHETTRSDAAVPNHPPLTPKRNAPAKEHFVYQQRCVKRAESPLVPAGAIPGYVQFCRDVLSLNTIVTPHFLGLTIGAKDRSRTMGHLQRRKEQDKQQLKQQQQP